MKQKYIELLLKRCLNFDKSKSLFISFNPENIDFVKEIAFEANKMGIEDIYLNIEDPYITHDILKTIEFSDIDNEPYFNWKKWDEYALKDSSFLILETEMPGLMDDIEPEKIARFDYITRATRPLYKKKQLEYVIPWCIAALPTESWAKDVFPNEPNAYEKLFEIICKMCMADTEDPIMSWNNHLAESSKIVDQLNSKSISEMHYKNSLGTDLYIALPTDHIWCNASKKDMIVNMPSYEIFTTPDYTKTNGIVYSSRPLVYNGKTINEFFIEFENGKAINYGAKKGYEILKSIILNDDYSGYLGEAALINYNSPISNTNKVFGNTLFDENASCHLALGSGFPNCLKNSNGISREELRKFGINSSKCHVDFMIGTSDLNITAKTVNAENITIFESGNFSKVLVK